MTKTRDEIDAEKAHKSRPDLLPSSALIAAGRVMGYGLRKHGDCTWRIAGTEQADPRTHLASCMRHLLETLDDIDALDDESGLEQLACVITQACIAYDCRKAEIERDGDLGDKIADEAATPVTVGSAFAAGAIEGEDPLQLPAGWTWHDDHGYWYALDERGLNRIDPGDSDDDVRRWGGGRGGHTVDELTRVRELVRGRNGYTP